MRNIFTPVALLLFLTAAAQDGSLDLNYGTGGLVVNPTTPPVLNSTRQQIRVLSNNKILHVYTAETTPTNSDFGLARYNDDGSLDNTFGTNGIVTTDFGSQERATSVTVQPDGKIIVAGYTGAAGAQQFALARYTVNGVLDNTFGTGGIVTTPIGVDASAFDVYADATGILLVGNSLNAVTMTYDFTLARYTTTGTLDNTFGTGGIVTTQVGIISSITSVAIQPDGKIVVAGFSDDGTGVDFALGRYSATGAPDLTFGFNGISVVPVGTGGNAAAYDVLINPADGKIYAAGSANNGTNNDFALTRFTTTGALDNTFSGDGIETTNISGDEGIFSIELQTDGKILAAGTTNSGGVGTNDFVIARYNSTGPIDFNFGGSMTGYNVIDFGADDYGYDIDFHMGGILFGGIKGQDLATARLVNSFAVLPVGLLTFSAEQRGGAVELLWQTTWEENAVRFDVMRSVDGSRFTKIGSVNAVGNSSSRRDYSFTDHQPLPSVNYYRLRIADEDGSVTYSNILMVKSASIVKLEAYPNPVKYQLNVQLKAKAGLVKLKLVEASGRTIRTSELRSTGQVLSTSIDMSGLSKGLYFLLVNDEVIKVVKE